MTNSETNPDIISKHSVAQLVTKPFVNTRCIVCGTAFERARVGKLYCSTRCKQFGYNHKDQLEQAKDKVEFGINSRPLSFDLGEFLNYDKIRKDMICLRELARKKREWEALDSEIRLKESQLLPTSDYKWERYYSQKMTDDEEFQLYDLETNLDEKYLTLSLKELSLEQWSFLRSIHSSLDEFSFFQLVSSVSKQFIAQLSLRENDSNNNDFLIIQNKFINHCNLIASGVIIFQKGDEEKLTHKSQKSG